MKKLNFTFLFTMLMSMVGLNASAHDIAVQNADGKTIYYNYINNTELAVTYRGYVYNDYSNEYTGNVVIPESATYNNRTYSVTSIGNGAFRDCSGLTSVTIPNSVTSIGGYAFYNCSGLTSIEIPNSVTSIGEYAFDGTAWYGNQLDGLVYAGKVAYKYKGTMPENTSITIKDGTCSITGSAFDSCSGLTSVTIPNNVTSIGSYAFRGCSGLTSIDIPNSVTSIGDHAFYGCSGLTSVTIPNSVTSIGGSAFSNCFELTLVESRIGKVYGIADNIFSSDTYNNAELRVPRGLSSMYKRAIGWTNFKSITEGDLQICGDNLTYTYSEASGKLTIQGTGAMYDYSSSSPAPWNSYEGDIITIVIEDGATSVGSYAFSDCNSLYSVTFGKDVKTVGSRAFWDCQSLKKVIAPDIAAWCGINFGNETANPLYYVHHLYSDKSTEITELVIPDGVTSIGSYAFSGWSVLPSVTIPNSVTSIGSSAFSGCSGLTSVTIGTGVTSIGSDAFSGCSGLTSVTINSDAILSKTYTSSSNLSNIFGGQVKQYIIGNSVTSIGGYAFYGCSNLNKIVIPGIAKWCSVKIGACALPTTFHIYSDEVTEITSLDIPEGVTSINAEVFNGCAWITSVSIPNTVTSIGLAAFQNCSGLTSLTIPNSVTSIGDYALRYCSRLTSVTIGSGVTGIGGSAFSGCSGLTSVTINSNAILSKAYTSSSNLSNIFGSQVQQYIIGNSVTSIGSSAFYGCSGLASVTIGSGVTSIGGYAFNGCSGLQKVITTDIAAWCGINFGNSYANPLYYVHHLYSDKSTEITELVIPDGVTNIGSYAFSGWSVLPSVTIPNSVTSIGDHAFYGCSGLTSVTIPNSVTSIGKFAFYGCSGLTSVTIPNSVTSIGGSAFSGCSKLTSVTFHCNNVDAGFSGVSSIKEVWIEKEVTSIAQYSFAGCSGLQSVYNNAEDVFTIPKNTFDDATYSSAKLYVPTGMKATYEETPWWLNFNKIEEYDFPTASGTCGKNLTWAYYEDDKKLVISGTGAMVDYDGNSLAPWNSYRDNIENVVFEEGVTSIGSHAFWNCSGLTSITIPNSVKIIGMSTFEYCSGLTSVTIPNSVTSIGLAAFQNCSGLTSLTIPNSVTSIGESAFSGCSKLTSITIPNSVTSIGESAFSGCSGLTSVCSYIEEPASVIGSNFDNSNYSNATLYVPFGTKDKYLATDGWKNFTNIVEMEPQPTASGTCGENLTWAYYEVDKKLVISGTGAMVDYDGTSLAPWNSYRDNIENVVFEEGVTSIGNFAICKCSGLTSVTIPNSVTSIGYGAFLSCSGLTSITIPNSVTSIGEGAFSGCSGLTSVTIPNSVTSIEYHAFSGCSGLTSITIPNSVTSVGEGAFSGCSGLTSVTIPNSVTSIEKDAFEDCRDLTSLSLGENVKSIGVRAFNQCTALTSISIPNSVTSIETDAFDDCTALTSIYSYIENPTNNTGSNFDSSNYSNATLYVPQGTKDKYLATDGWKNFTNIVEMSIEPIVDETVIEFDDKDFIVDNTPVDLNNTVINDMYISMDNKSDVNNPDGFYDSTDKCIVINKATSASAIATAVASNLGSSDFINNYTGIVIEVNGKGSVKINAQTAGNNKLAVKIGSADAMTYTLASKGDVTINYDVTENTYVYIYAVDADNQQQSLSMDITDTSDNAVKVYSVTVTPDATAIETVTEADIPAAVFGKVYSIDGKQLAQPQKGLNILKMSDGTTIKVVK